MKVVLHDLAKRYNREWIFRSLSHEFKSGSKTVVLGPNGSGKSTLLQNISGILSPTSGTIDYEYASTKIPVDEIFKNLSIAAPYLDLPEEMTLYEVIEFHFSFKKIDDKMTLLALVDLLGMQSSINKQVRYFSSGMKQRLKLALACCSDTPLLLLDEPCSNLDQNGVEWYKKLIGEFAESKTVIVCSNQPQEYTFCNTQIMIADYK